MNLKLGLDKDFEDTLHHLKSVFGEEMFKLDGLDEDTLDSTEFFKSFIHSDNVANASIDDNSNVNAYDINTLLTEIHKPLNKILSYNKLFIELKEKFGIDEAKKWLTYQISGTTYLHDSDSASYKPYCYAVSLKSLVEKGLFFIPEMRAFAPKHLVSFNMQVLQFVSYVSNQQSGAVGLPDYLLYSFYFWKKDIESGYIPEEKKEQTKLQEFQSMIYNLNQPFMRVNQSAYTNFTIVDRDYFIGLFGDLVFPDGTLAIDIIEEFMQYQKDWLAFIRKERERKSFTFPVITLSCLYKDNEFKDDDMVRYVINHNIKWGDVNIYISKSVDTLASCCFIGNQNTLIITPKNRVAIHTFDSLYHTPELKNENLRILHNGNWLEGRLVRLPRGQKKLYKITTVNNTDLCMTEDHINVTLEGEKRTDMLSNNDYIAFNITPIQPLPEKDEKLSYEQGVLIGACLGDGSKKTNLHGITYTVSKSKFKELIPMFDRALKQWEINTNLIIDNGIDNYVNITINNEAILPIVDKYILCDNSNINYLNPDIMLQSIDFRQGVLDGVYATDGNNSGMIYTTSGRLVYSLEALFTSLGKQSIIEDESIKEKYRVSSPMWCIRACDYTDENNNSIDGNYIKKNNTLYIKIKSIEDISNMPSKEVYCFEMKNKEEPYFTLPNGVITHNCRLLNNVEEIKKNKLEGHFNSIGGSDLNIGSTKVNTINLARVGYIAKGDIDIALETLGSILDNIHKVLEIHRDILKKNISRGLLPLYKYGVISLDRQFATVGITGMMEYIDSMGGLEKTPSGVAYNDTGLDIAVKTLDYINKKNEEASKKVDFTYNLEQIPGESATIKLCKKDKLLFKDAQKYKLYSNQWIALTETADMFERIRVSGYLDKKCGGGQMLHITLGEEYKNEEQAFEMAKFLARKGVIYYSDVKIIQYCKNDHNFYGNTCGICGEKAEGNITKIVGFMVKDAYFKKERKEELSNRHRYKQIDVEKLIDGTL